MAVWRGCRASQSVREISPGLAAESRKGSRWNGQRGAPASTRVVYQRAEASPDGDSRAIGLR